MFICVCVCVESYMCMPEYCGCKWREIEDGTGWPTKKESELNYISLLRYLYEQDKKSCENALYLSTKFRSKEN